MPKVIVGNAPVKVSWQEYAVAIMPKGTPVEWRDSDFASSFGNTGKRSGTGVFKFSSWYDGIAAHIDVMGETKIICVFQGTRIRRLKDASKAAAFGVCGEGI